MSAFNLGINAQRVRDIAVICGASWVILGGLWTFVGKPNAEDFVLQTVSQQIQSVVDSVDTLSVGIALNKYNQKMIQNDISAIKKSLRDKESGDKTLLEVLRKLNEKLDSQ